MSSCCSRAAAASLFILAAGPATLRAGEAPNVVVTQTDLRTIYLATPATSAVPGFLPHVNFPYLKARADGTLEAYASVGQTHGAGRFGIRGLSTDGGRTWTTSTSWPSTPASSIVRPAGQFSYGVSFAASSPSGISNWNNTRYVSTNGGTSWTFDTATFNTGSVLYGSIYNNLGDLVQSGSTLFATGFGPRQGQSTFESVLFASTNNGQSWSRRSTIAVHTSAPLVGMGSEGPNETGLVRLDNGNLLAVYRTGQPFATTDVNSTAQPLMWSMSGDQGFTWTAPKTLGVTGVWPTLRKLDNGLVALTTGRYGAKVMFADPTGLRWTKPTVIYNGPGSGHTELRQTAQGDYAFVYDQSSFYPPAYDPFPPAGYVYDNNQSGLLRSAILDITLAPDADDFRWLHEYHGDVAPDTLAGSGWTRATSGSPTLNLSADLGQDYLQTISNGASTDRLSFATTGAGTVSSLWEDIDFATTGVVLDVRARVVGGATAEGSADVYLGDGSTGAVTLQLAGAAVHLEGAGGQAQQATLQANQIPGFATTAWHDYRIVVGPDFAQGGIVRAAVYLDGNLTSPVLTQSLGLPGGLDAVEFGDRSVLAGGVMDLDFLRFAPLASEWKPDAPGDWHDPDAWTARVPDGPNAIARLAGAITAPRTVTLDSPVTLGMLRFESAEGYTVAGPGRLSMRVSSGTAMLVVQQGSHAITAPLGFVSPTSITGAGSLALGNLGNHTTLSVAARVSAGNVDGSGTLLVDAGGSLSLLRARQGTLVVNGRAAVIPGRAADKTSRVQSLSVGPAGRFDLGDNDLLIDYAGFTPRAAVEALVASAYAGGAWSGPGLLTSLSGPGGLLSLGVADASEVGAGASYNGIAIDATTVIVRYTLAGDANLSGGVDISDFSVLAGNFNQPGRWRTGDFDYDGVVGIADFSRLAANFNQLAPATPARPAAVPEPAAAALLAAASLLLPARPRARHKC